MEKETDTAKILRSLAGVHEKVDAIQDDLKTRPTKVEVASLISGKFAKLRTEDIEPIKRDIAALKRNAEKVSDVFAPRLEYDDRLRVIEQKLGILSPN
jgi:hypothetical protein